VPIRAARTGSKLSGARSPSANSAAESPCVLLYGKANLCASCSRPGKDDDWPPKMGRATADAYLMWPRLLRSPGCTRSTRFKPPTHAHLQACVWKYAESRHWMLLNCAQPIPSHQCPPSDKPERPTSIQGHVFQTKNASHIAFTVSSTVTGVVAVMSVPCVLGVPAAQPAAAAVGARLGMGEDIVQSRSRVARRRLR